LRGILGNRPGAEAAATEAAAIREELGLRENVFRLAYTELALGDLPTALRLARTEAAALEAMGDTGQRSTMVGLAAWILALTGEDDVEALRLAAESRKLGAEDDAVTQILWRIGEGVVRARVGEVELADRLTLEATDIADSTDSLDAGSAWLARAMVLTTHGRRAEGTAAARRARELFAAKGFVTALRRVDAILEA